MSVVVRMEMPKRCYECDLADGLTCMATGGVYGREVPKMIWIRRRPEWCPIICPLPEGHGRLGDLDALKDYLIAEAASYDLTQGQMGILSEAIDMIDEQPTIVSAERSET